MRGIIPEAVPVLFSAELMLKIQNVFTLLFLASSILGCNQIEKIVFGKKRPDHKDLRPCGEFLAELSADYQHGFLAVPEDWDNPDSNKIEVFYYTKLGGTSSDQDNVVFFNGGPTGDSHSSYSVLEPLADERDLDLVFIDQRGTGCSTRYPAVETYPEMARYAKWGSRAIVKDAEAVRAHLFGEESRWKVFGQSYGALIAHRYWQVAPQSVISSHAHGFALMKEYDLWLKERILNQKVAGEEFVKRYPSVNDSMKKIRENLTSLDCLEKETEKLCDDEIMDMFFDYLGWTEHWSGFSYFLETFASALEADKESAKKKLMAHLSGESDDESEYAGIAGLVISTMEMRGTKYTSDTPLDTCTRVLKELESDGHNLSDWLFNECRRNVSWKSTDNKSGSTYSLRNSLEEYIPHDPIPFDDLKDSFSQYQDRPFYLYSGKFDAYVPPATFKEEVEALGELIQYKEFPTTAHGGFYTETEVWENLEK